MFFFNVHPLPSLTLHNVDNVSLAESQKISCYSLHFYYDTDSSFLGKYWIETRFRSIYLCSSCFLDLIAGAVCFPCLFWGPRECTTSPGREFWSVTNPHIDRSEGAPGERKQPCPWYWLHAEGNQWYVWVYCNTLYSTIFHKFSKNGQPHHLQFCWSRTLQMDRVPR